MIRVIPLSFDTEWHVPGETVVFDHNNIRFLAEIFGESPMLAGNLSQYKGRLSSNDMERVKKAVSDFYSGEVLNLTPDYINWRKEELEYIYLGLVAPVNLSI